MDARQKSALLLLIDIVDRANVKERLDASSSPLVQTAVLNHALTDIYRRDGRHRVITIELVGKSLIVRHDYEGEDAETPVALSDFHKALESRSSS